MPRSQPPAAADLTWAQVHRFRLAGHHLLLPAPKKELARVAGDVGGLQAQLMSAAEMQAAVRADCTVVDVRTALWKDKKLVKTWLMRGTLHLVPADDLPLYTAAMRTRWIGTRKAWLDYTQLSEDELTELVAAIGDALDDQPVTRDELIARVGNGRPERIKTQLKSGWGGLLKPVARNGLLCFGPNRGASVTFVRPQKWLGRWRDVDPDAALVEVARRYLRVFGPATKYDFASWWGHWAGVGNAAWSGLAPELAAVSVEGQRADILSADLDRISSTMDEPSVRLLPSFDPYLMGHANRDHLFPAELRWRVSRVSGWISAVVLVDGRVAGTWTHKVVKRALVVTVDPLRKLSASTLKDVRARADSLGDALGLDEAAVKIA